MAFAIEFPRGRCCIWEDIDAVSAGEPEMERPVIVEPGPRAYRSGKVQQRPLFRRKVGGVGQHLFLGPGSYCRKRQPHRTGDYELAVIVEVEYQATLQ
jgi:hypothetical protein